MWSLIGLYSPKGPEWANMGRSFIRGDPELGARHPSRTTTACGAERAAASAVSPISTASSSWRKSIGTEGPARRGQERPQVAVTPDHKDYAALMGAAPRAAVRPKGGSAMPQRLHPRMPAQPARGLPPPVVPSWAQ
jgi:hypothetical protein